jgi:hypothetical protein
MSEMKRARGQDESSESADTWDAVMDPIAVHYPLPPNVKPMAFRFEDRFGFLFLTFALFQDFGGGMLEPYGFEDYHLPCSPEVVELLTPIDQSGGWNTIAVVVAFEVNTHTF